MSRNEVEIHAGAVSVGMHYRDDIPGDEGLCIQVRADVDGRGTELLRFDCFQQAPHYHYGPEAGNERIMFNATAGGDTLQWTLERFEGGRLSPMIERAGYPAIAAAVDAAAIAAALPEVIRRAHAIVGEHASSDG